MSVLGCADSYRDVEPGLHLKNRRRQAQADSSIIKLEIQMETLILFLKNCGYHISKSKVS